MPKTSRGEIAFTVVTPHPDNPALIFVHDWGCTSRIWKEVVKHLGAFRCITYDQRGWGRTQPANGFSYTLDILSGDVSALARQLNGKEFVLVAHGIGGRVALRFAERKPVGLAGLVLIACAPHRRQTQIVSHLRSDTRCFWKNQLCQIGFDSRRE
jgi:pimeloyl-ACP methyl ester carboxylesterase